MADKVARAGAITAVADALASRVGEVGGNCLTVECVEAADLDRGDAVANRGSVPWRFRRRFRGGFRRPFPIRSGGSGAIRHRIADRGDRVLPTSPRPIEVCS
jgi:hypothetical protein